MIYDLEKVYINSLVLSLALENEARRGDDAASWVHDGEELV